MKKYFFDMYIQIDQRFPMQQSGFKISDSVESYDGKTDEITTLWKSALFPNYRRCRIQIWIAQIEDLNANGVKILRSYLLYLFEK